MVSGRRTPHGPSGGVRRHSPGHQRIEVDRLAVSADRVEDAREPSPWVVAVHLGRLDQRVEHRGRRTAAVRAGEQPVLAADRDGAFIVPLIFKCLGTLGSAPRRRPDADVLFVRAPP